MHRMLIGGLVALACGCGTTQSRPSYATLEDLAQAIVVAVKSGQPEPLKALLITDAELEATLAVATIPEEERATVIADVRSRLAAFESRWGRLQADIARRGVSLGELTYLGIAKGKVGHSHGFEHLDSDLDIHVGNRDDGKLVIDVEECIRTPRGWRLGDPEVEVEVRH